MKKAFLHFLLVLIFASTMGLFVSCKEKIMGYSVVLWNVPECNLQDGDVVPVYIRSNISHVYVIGVEDEIAAANGIKKELEKKEVPLWQLTEPVKKSKIDAVQKKYTEYAHKYASVKTDGLPARAEPVNTSKQVYRLRKNEVIKILYQGQGQAPMTGGKPLEGEWYRILADDGTQGWCFSYNLVFFETDRHGKRIGNADIDTEDEEDVYYNNIINKTWYPDSFRTMIQNGNIDLTKIHPSYNFMLDEENQKVSLNLTKIHESWDYEGYTKTNEKQYTLKNIPIIIVYKKADFIVVRYTGPDGKPQELNFVRIDGDLNEIIAEEKTRRTEAFNSVVEHGPNFRSSNYGTLVINADGSFRWTNYKLLVPSIISASAKNTGTVSVKYAVGKNLAASYDGVLTFKFEGMTQEVNFLYKKEEGRLRLEDATEATINGNLITAKGSSPITLSFSTK